MPLRLLPSILTSMWTVNYVSNCKNGKGFAMLLGAFLLLGCGITIQWAQEKFHGKREPEPYPEIITAEETHKSPLNIAPFVVVVSHDAGWIFNCHSAFFYRPFDFAISWVTSTSYVAARKYCRQCSVLVNGNGALDQLIGISLLPKTVCRR